MASVTDATLSTIEGAKRHRGEGTAVGAKRGVRRRQHRAVPAVPRDDRRVHSALRSDAAYLDRGVVEACPLGEIGPEICGDQSRDCLPGAARRQPCALLARNNPGWHVISHLERQDDLAAVVPYTYFDAAPEASRRSILGVHQKRRRLARTNEAAEGRGNALVGRRRD